MQLPCSLSIDFNSADSVIVCGYSVLALILMLLLLGSRQIYHLHTCINFLASGTIVFVTFFSTKCFRTAMLSAIHILIQKHFVYDINADINDVGK